MFFLQETQYRRYENGESDLPLEWAKKFARFYNVSIDFIAGLTSVPKPLDETQKTIELKDAKFLIGVKKLYNECYGKTK